MQTVIETKTGWMIRCFKCGSHEFPKAKTPGKSWSFDGNMEEPTFTPSMNETVGPFPEDSQWTGQIRRCHFTVQTGLIIYHADCSHEMRGIHQLKPWTQPEIDYYKGLLEQLS